MSAQTKGSDRARLVLRVSVDLGGGRSSVIEVREGSDAETLARAFCQREGVPVSVAGRLSEEIASQVRRVEQSKLEAESRETKLTDGGEDAAADADADAAAGAQSEMERKEAYYRSLQQRYQKNEKEKQKKQQKLQRQDSLRTQKREAAKKPVVLSAREAQAACERLYSDGVQARSRGERERRAALHAKESRELRECTFRPEISSFAREVQGGRMEGPGLEMQVRRFHETRLVRDHLKQEQAAQLVQEQCSFRPSISAKSHDLAQQQRAAARAELEQALESDAGSSIADGNFAPCNGIGNGNGNSGNGNSGTGSGSGSGSGAAGLHADLHKEAEARTAARARLQQTGGCSFQPEIVGADRLRRRADESEASFLERLAAPKAEDANTSALAERLRFDAATGQPLFTPQVGRPPREAWARPADVSVSDYLFHSRHQFQDIKDGLRRRQEAAQQELFRSGGAMNDRSRAIADRVRSDRFAGVWDALNDEALARAMRAKEEGKKAKEEGKEGGQESQEAQEAQETCGVDADVGVGTVDSQVGEDDQLRLRCLVELLPELLLRRVGPDAILAAAEQTRPLFVAFMEERSKGVPCNADLVLS